MDKDKIINIFNHSENYINYTLEIIEENNNELIVPFYEALNEYRNSDASTQSRVVEVMQQVAKFSPEYLKESIDAIRKSKELIEKYKENTEVFTLIDGISLNKPEILDGVSSYLLSFKDENSAICELYKIARYINEGEFDNVQKLLDEFKKSAK